MESQQFPFHTPRSILQALKSKGTGYPTNVSNVSSLYCILALLATKLGSLVLAVAPSESRTVIGDPVSS